MKDLAALELHYLLKELMFLKGAKVDKIYHPHKREVLLQFYVKGKGKQLLRICIPEVMYLSSYKQEQPEKPSQFCVVLRKYLDNTFLVEINQLGFERIVEFVFEGRGERYKLMVELFSKGNIVLCKEDDTIIMPLEVQQWSIRTIKPKETYLYPKQDVNFLELTKDGLTELLKKSKKMVVKTLARNLGLGGVYAEEMCLRAGIDKTKIDVDEREIILLYKAAEQLKSERGSPTIVHENGTVKDIVPIDVRNYDGLEKSDAKSYNEALDAVLTKRLAREEKSEKLSKQERQISKVKTIIDKQEEYVKKLERDSEESTKKAELLYHNYTLVDTMLKDLRKARKTRSWKEIKEKLKGHKVVKQINEKNKEVMIALDEK